MTTFALVGRNIGYSFSQKYFTEKFKREGINDCEYIYFDIQNLNELPALLKSTSNLRGMNVTIPYKREVMKLLTAVDATAQAIGAVNTIKVTPDGLVGYNTDYYGFSKSLSPLLQPQHTHALILGTGGASSAVAYALKNTELTKEIIENYHLIINCTPLGTFPNINDCPPIPYQYLTPEHLLYDLIYNPSQTTFLHRGEKQGATTCNGQLMLELQAEKAWEIWNKE